MKRNIILTILASLVLLLSSPAHAVTKQEPPAHVVILLDLSGSMAQSVEGERKSKLLNGLFKALRVFYLKIHKFCFVCLVMKEPIKMQGKPYLVQVLKPFTDLDHMSHQHFSKH